MMTFEGQQFQGPQNICTKFKNLGQTKHTVQDIDIQPSFSANAIMIFVNGVVQIGGTDANPIHFCQSFQLVSQAPGQYYVHNAFFRLVYA